MISKKQAFIIAYVSIEPGITTIQQIPANFNTFLYVLKGSVKVGEDEKLLSQEQVGWLNLVGNNQLSELKLAAGKDATHLNRP